MGRPKTRTELSAKVKKTLPKPKGAPRGKPFPPGHPYRFPPGVSGNPGGKPRVFTKLSEAYAQLMKEECYLDPYHRTWGELAAEGMFKASVKGNPAATKEIRQALEGDRVRTWQDDVIQALKEGRLEPEEVIRELGDETAKPLITAAGVSSESGEVTSQSADEKQPG